MRIKKILICLIVGTLMFYGVTVLAGLHKTLEKAQKKIVKITKVEEGTYYPDPENTNVIDDSTPELNFANPGHPLHNKIKMPDLESQRKEKRKAKESEQPSEPPGTGDYYTWMQTSRNTGITGIYAQQEIASALPPLGVNWNFPFNSTRDQTIYAPTLMCPNYATMEVVTVHYQPAGYTTASHTFSIWDWRAGHSGWIVSKFINSTFLNNYVRSYPEGILYFVRVSVYANGSNRDTTVYLWNFNANNGAGAWEIQKQHINESSGMPYGSAGWDMWESYMDDGSGGYLCPSIPNIESKNLQVYWNGSWNFVNSNFGSLQDQLSPPKCNYPRTMYDNFFYWSVN